MDYAQMEVELTKAFIKAVNLDDYNSMLCLNKLNNYIGKYRRNKDYPMLRVCYKKVIDVMENNAYMNVEKEHIRQLLRDNDYC